MQIIVLARYIYIEREILKGYKYNDHKATLVIDFLVDYVCVYEIGCYIYYYSRFSQIRAI